MDKKKVLNRAEIAGVGVQLNSDAIQNCKNVDDLKKLETFSHLPENMQEAAYEKLWEAIEAYEKDKETDDKEKATDLSVTLTES